MLLDIDEITDSVLKMSWKGAATLDEFLQFERPGRQFASLDALRGCHVFSISPIERVKGPGWGDEGPAHPGVFADQFAAICASLLPPEHSIFFQITAMEDWLFDEGQVLKEDIRPRGLRYMLLSPLGTWRPVTFLGHLVFECPLDFIPSLVEKSFTGFRVDVEAYVMPSDSFGQFAACYFRSDTPETVRDTLSLMHCAFRVWPDKNGMELYTDKFDLNAIQNALSRI